MSKRLKVSLVIGWFASAVTFSAGAQAQVGDSGFEPFNSFIQRVSTAEVASVAAAPGAKVSDAAEIERMRQHVLSLYAGVAVSHSFVADGQYFDCVGLTEQPSLRALGLKSLASPPPLPPASPAVGAIGPGGAPQALADQSRIWNGRDRFGNTQTCEAGRFPMRRVTLEEIARFGTLRQFFQKGADGAGEFRPPGDLSPASLAHKYAHALQYVTNYGGSSSVNLWSPNLSTIAANTNMSLSQHWYVNYTADGSAVQTAEGGWQNLPNKYGINKSVLFIYWTADGYNKTGCYDLDCVGFVQYDPTLPLARAFSNYSVSGGTQYVFQMTYELYKGNWWFGFNGHWGGYFPGKIYGTGKLAQNASMIDYGGETVGTPTYPPMGSGAFASGGFGHSAYQALVKYYTSGTATTMKDATLVEQQPSPTCYTDDMHDNSGVSGYSTYFFFGGPGGSGC